MLSSSAICLLGAVGFAVNASAQAGSGFAHRFYLTPEEIQAEDTRVIAEKLARRLQERCDLSVKPVADERPVGDDADVIMMVPQEAFASIARHGFLNQHVTSTTRGFNRTLARYQAEQELAMLRLPYSHKGRTLLPKYALMNVHRVGFGAFTLPGRYGGVAVVFKKDVLRRVTWTYADSLDFSQKVGRFKLGRTSNPVLPRTAGHRRGAGDVNVCVNYCEAQIWGELSLRDVDYLMVRDSEAVHAAVLGAGLPVYRFSSPDVSTAVVAPGMTAQYVRGEPIGVELSTRAPLPGPSSLKELWRERLSVSDPAGSGLLDSLELSLLSAPELMRRLSGVGRVDAPGMMNDRHRLLGELAARPRNGSITRVLRAALRSRDEMERAIALHGLSGLPTSELRPVLLKAFKDPSPAVLMAAVAIAAERADDASIRSGLQALQRDSADVGVQEWLERVGRQQFCQ